MRGAERDVAIMDEAWVRALTAERFNPRARRWLLLAVLVPLGVFAVGCGTHGQSGCRDGDFTAAFVDELGASATVTDTTFTPLGVVDNPDRGCEHSNLNVERVGDPNFLVALSVAAVDADSAASLLRDQVRRRERFTENSKRDDRAIALEEALTTIDGLDQAIVEARCSEAEYTCYYSIAVDGWLVEAQLLYLGRIASYESNTAMGDQLLVDTARQIGQVVHG